MMNNIFHYLTNYMSKQPNNIFLTEVGSGKKYSYMDLYKLSLFYANFLKNNSVKEGDIVFFIAANNINFFPFLFACSFLQCILMPLSPKILTIDLQKLIDELSPVLIVHETQSDRVVNTKQLPIFIAEDLKQDFRNDLLLPLSLENVPSEKTLILIGTSGTTGKSKYVMLSEKNLLAGATSIVNFYGISVKDTTFCIMPLYHMNAVMVTGMMPFVSGGQIILSESLNFQNAKFYLRDVDLHKPTILSLTPSIMAVLLKLFPEGYDLSQQGVQFCFCGAAPLSEKLWRQFEKYFNTIVYQGYGLSETTIWATVTPKNKSLKNYCSVGVAPTCKIKIDNPNSKGIGEILIAGELVANGYYGQPSFLRDGYFPTGDLGCFNDDKELCVVGRIKEIIIKNAINIYPQDIDYYVQQFPNIEESATVGVSDELVGERIYTFCVPTLATSNIEPKDIKTFLIDKIAEHMIPDQIIFLEKLPKGDTGKILKRVLVESVQHKEIC